MMAATTFTPPRRRQVGHLIRLHLHSGFMQRSGKWQQMCCRPSEYGQCHLTDSDIFLYTNIFMHFCSMSSSHLYLVNVLLSCLVFMACSSVHCSIEAQGLLLWILTPVNALFVQVRRTSGVRISELEIATSRTSLRFVRQEGIQMGKHVTSMEVLRR